MNWRDYFKVFWGDPQKKTPVAAGVQSGPPISGYISKGDTYMFTMVHESSGNVDLLPSINGSGGSSRAERWLSDRLKKGAKRQFAEIGTLTPDLARLLLEKNPHNRKVKSANVERFARDIENDRFVFNGEPIIIAETGELNDGQNRCQAVIHAQKPIRTMFVFGVSRESRTTVDQGAARTAGDYLSMDGIANSNNLAATASKVIEIEKLGKLTTNNAERATKSEIIERVKDDPAIAESFHFVYRTGGARVAPFSLLATAHYLLASVNGPAADDFMSKLIEGTDLKARDPVFVAREKLIGKERLTPNEKLKTIIMAWNNYRARRTVKSLTHSIRKGETLPEAR